MGPPLLERMSKSQADSGMWQLRQGILLTAPMGPSCPSCGVPVWIGPDRRGSKNSFCPSSAALSELRYLLVVSRGRSGRGESLCSTDQSLALNPSASAVSAAVVDATSTGEEPLPQPIGTAVPIIS